MVSQTLLLLEDEMALAQAAIRSLTHSGFDVVHAATCDDALRSTRHFDVGVFDVNLPDGNGLDVAMRLKNECRVARIVFFTASVEPTTLVEAERLGPVVRKSDGLDALCRAVRGTEAPRGSASEPG